ncbi:unnamed protein product [Strongylus vulgaris]|uniref:Mvd1 C-terminal domain-containing protein n=1 Tax=Strongylus vulgaris TaxID=40348 RepID=A0A3P7IBI5_STRVU|nr:unnamed protein product [Strongylus vulgaris]
MRRTVETSELLKYRAKRVVPERIKRLTAAFKVRNFYDFASITMADSNQLHAVCLDSFPPLRVRLQGSGCTQESNAKIYPVDVGAVTLLYHYKWYDVF